MTLNTTLKPMLAITMGDVNGVGPEILARALGRTEFFEHCTPVVFGGCAILQDAAAKTAQSLTLEIAEAPDSVIAEGAIRVIECGVAPTRLVPGTVQHDAGAAAVAWIRGAVQAAIDGKVAGLVTCPINKECIHLAGSDAIGHTEIVAEMTHTTEYRMSLFTDRMRIVHISAHVPLARALELVTTERIVSTIRIAHDALVRLGLVRRRIAVAGLNPHAGENGLLGNEESEIISPAIAACGSEGIDCSGPYPPDTVFRRMMLGEFDLVVAMYHDQGHIALKLVAMDEGVNITLGIPIIRTSVDHGTAYDIAWKGIAREDSLIAAARLASQLAIRK